MRERIIAGIRDAGVVGAGGAGLPTHVKADASVDTSVTGGPGWSSSTTAAPTSPGDVMRSAVASDPRSEPRPTTTVDSAGTVTSAVDAGE